MKSLIVWMSLSCLTVLIQPGYSQALWSGTYGPGTPGGLVNTSDGGYALVFSSYQGTQRSEDIKLIKLNEHGDVQWSNLYGSEEFDGPCGLIELGDEGFLILGISDLLGNFWRSNWIVRVNNTGDTLWTHAYDEIFETTFKTGLLTENNSILLAGVSYRYSDTTYRVTIIEIALDGEINWQRTYDYMTDVSKIISLGSGGYALAGSNGYGAYNDIVYTRIDSLGDPVNTTQFQFGSYSTSYDLAELNDGNLIMAISTTNWQSDRWDGVLMKMTFEGDSLWANSYGGELNDFLNSVYPDYNENVFVAGSTLSFGSGNADVWLLKVDSSGETLWSNSYGGAGYDRDPILTYTLDQGLIFTAKTNSFGLDGFNVWLVKTDYDGQTGPLSLKPGEKHLRPGRFGIENMYPNPFNSTINFDIYLHNSSDVLMKIFDISGRLAFEASTFYLPAGKKTFSWNGKSSSGDDLASGIYYVQISNSEQVCCTKITLLK